MKVEIYEFLNIKEDTSRTPKKYIYNFAGLYGGATVLEKNPNCLNAKSVLSDNFDKYITNRMLFYSNKNINFNIVIC
jgi:hypothetical protein